MMEDKEVLLINSIDGFELTTLPKSVYREKSEDMMQHNEKMNRKYNDMNLMDNYEVSEINFTNLIKNADKNDETEKTKNGKINSRTSYTSKSEIECSNIKVKKKKSRHRNNIPNSKLNDDSIDPNS